MCVFDRILHANNGLFHNLLVCTSLEKLSCATHEYSDFWYIPKYGFCKWSQVQFCMSNHTAEIGNSTHIRGRGDMLIKDSKTESLCFIYN